jgi:hypothetical protein
MSSLVSDSFDRSLRAILFLLLAALHKSFSGCGSSSSDPPALNRDASFEGGILYTTSGEGGSGTFDVLVLNGDWRQMGRQYGYLTRAKLADFYASSTEYLLSKGATQQQISDVAETFYQSKMDYIKELIIGMAETSGMSLEQQKRTCAAGLMIVFAGCSSMDAWGDYTGGGQLVAGRNWDVGAHMNAFSRFMTVAVYNPTGSSIPVADINYLGWFLFQSAMNKSGIFLDLQNGSLSDSSSRSDVSNTNDTLFTFLLNSSTLEQLDDRFLANSPGAGLVMNAVDETRGRVYEWATHDVKIRNSDGLIASTNHFIDPSWGLPTPPDGEPGGFSKERLANLLSLGENYKGKIDAAAMQEIFGKTIDQGGPTFPNGKTNYQIVAVPAERTVWLKATGYSGWEKIALGPLFR